MGKRLSSRYHSTSRTRKITNNPKKGGSNPLWGASVAILGTVVGVLIAHFLNVDYSSRAERRDTAMAIIELADQRLQLSRFVYKNCNADKKKRNEIFTVKWNDYMQNGVKLWSNGRPSNRRLIEFYFPDSLDEFDALDEDFRRAHSNSYHEAFMDIKRRTGTVTTEVYLLFEHDIYSNEGKLKMFSNSLFEQL